MVTKKKTLKTTLRTTKNSTSSHATLIDSQPVPPMGKRKRKISSRVRSLWKPVPKSTKTFVLQTFDASIRLLMHKAPENIYEDIHDALVDSRNEVAKAMELLKTPTSKENYNLLGSTLSKLRDTKQGLERRLSSLSTTVDKQQREIQELEAERDQLQNFFINPSQHHPFLLEPFENELHLTFNSVT